MDSLQRRAALFEFVTVDIARLRVRVKHMSLVSYAKAQALLAEAAGKPTFTAIRLLSLARTPLKIVIFERSPECRYGGLAYGEGLTGWEHLLNIQAGRCVLLIFKNFSTSPSLCKQTYVRFCNILKQICLVREPK